MANIPENLHRWNAEYEWPEGGDEWSVAWGGAESQWCHTLYPRIRRFVPAPTILEIAPGFGRWTQYLKDLCSRLEVVDLAENCIKACRQRFAECSHIGYHVNDGSSLAMIQDGSIDFAFSFDSLVHVESEVLDAYVEQLAAKLSPNGVGFFHHSNIGMYADLIASGRMSNDHWRAQSATAAKFRESCARYGLRCLHQELLSWAQDQYLTDCISVFTPRRSRWAGENGVAENLRFMQEAGIARDLSRLQPRFERRPERQASDLEAQLREVRAELEQLRRSYEESEADRAARLRVIEDQGRRLGELEGQRNQARAELEQLRATLNQMPATDRPAGLRARALRAWRLVRLRG